MSTYVLMRLLESVPSRYDGGIRLLTLGKLDDAYSRLTSRIREGDRVLDIGCGTGALTLMAARRKALVKGIDISAGMMEIAHEKLKQEGLNEHVELCEMGVAELGGEETESYDAVMSGLCFSELTEAEFSFALRETIRVLKPGGLLLAADEVKPEAFLKRLISGLVRIPLLAIAYALTQTGTRSINELPERVEKAGLVLESIRTNALGNFMELVGRKPVE